jgi:hypothetical protein
LDAAALGAAALAAVLAAVLGGALVAVVLAAVVLAAGALTGALTGVLAVVLAEFFVITLLLLEGGVLAGLTETTPPFLWDAPDFGALAADERAVVAFGERATATREALADFAVNFLALVLEFFALW